MREYREVRVTADEFGGHVPIWFPPPIADDVDKMPVSPTLLSEFREWNRVHNDVADAGALASTEHARVGRALSQRLADELGDDYVVLFRRFGGLGGGWETIEPEA